MLCRICGREKHSGHFTQKPKTTETWHGRTLTSEHAGRIPVCDDCHPSNINEIAEQVADKLDIDVEVNADAYIKVRR